MGIITKSTIPLQQWSKCQSLLARWQINMSVRTKTLIIVSSVLVPLILLLYVLSGTLLAGSYGSLEVRESQQNLLRVLNATQSQIDQLKSVALDWSRWDDVRDFILAPSLTHPFIDANMMDETFINQAFNYAAFINIDGEVVYEKMVDLEAQQAIPVPTDMRQHLSLTAPLLQHRDDYLSQITGVLALDEGMMFVISLPVTSSASEPPINGYMIWGRYLNSAIVQHASTLTGLTVDIQPYTADMEAAKAPLALNTAHVEPLDDNTVAAYSTINDLYGQPALMVKVQNSRDIMHLGRQNWNYFFFSLMVLGASSVIIVLFLLERGVLSRLARLNKSMAQVTATGNTSVPIEAEGSDELAQLGRTILHMLGRLATSRATLQSAHDMLEARVLERTAELADVNRQLLAEIAERKEAQSELAIARDQALEALRLKTEILANVSHDARTPLNIVTLNTEMLQRGRGGELSERGKQMLENILINARHLLNFHNNLLGEAQLGHTRVKLQRQPLDVPKLLQDVASLTQPLAERKGLAFHIELAPELDSVQSRMLGDAERLKQMLVNLVDNAIKFTDTGSVTLAARLQSEQAWALEVRDTGAGIPPEAQPRVFEAFYQVDGSVTRSTTRGVGLGLSIVKQLANLMGATIQIESKVGCGTTFTIAIPFEKESDDLKQPTAA